MKSAEAVGAAERWPRRAQFRRPFHPRRQACGEVVE